MMRRGPAVEVVGRGAWGGEGPVSRHWHGPCLATGTARVSPASAVPPSRVLVRTAVSVAPEPRPAGHLVDPGHPVDPRRPVDSRRQNGKACMDGLVRPI